MLNWLPYYPQTIPVCSCEKKLEDGVSVVRKMSCDRKAVGLNLDWNVSLCRHFTPIAQGRGGGVVQVSVCL